MDIPTPILTSARTLTLPLTSSPPPSPPPTPTSTLDNNSGDIITITIVGGEDRMAIIVFSDDEDDWVEAYDR